MMTLVQTESRYCSNFLSGRAKCSNSRPAKNLGRTSGITLNIQEFTSTWHVFILEQKPWRKIYTLFSMIDSLVSCSDIPGLITELGVTYNATERRIFIDASKRNLRAVLLHNGNRYASGVGHSLYSWEETYENLSILLKNIKYNEHNWLVCGYVKVIGILLL